MYQIGDRIVYGTTGVCRVASISRPDMAQDNRMYYQLVPLFEAGVIYAPVDSNMVFTRPVISRREAEQLIDSIPSRAPQLDLSQNAQQLATHYRTMLDHCCCADLLDLTISIHKKKQLLAHQNRRFGQIDGRYMKRAEEMLFGELAVALDITPEHVPQYIMHRIGDDTEQFN